MCQLKVRERHVPFFRVQTTQAIAPSPENTRNIISLPDVTFITCKQLLSLCSGMACGSNIHSTAGLAVAAGLRQLFHSMHAPYTNLR